MYKMVFHNHLFCVGKVYELLELLEDLSNQYTTLENLIEDHLKFSKQSLHKVHK